MARIYKRTDRITVRIDDVTLKLAPLSLAQKTEIQDAMFRGQTKGDLKEMTRGIALSIKYAVKGIQGVVDGDGIPYKLEEENGELTTECVDELLNLDLTAKLSRVCVAMVNGVPTRFTDDKNIPLEGVEVVSNSESVEKKP
jgi:hypothetical protein